MVAHRAGVGEQPVERDECRNAGKQRQQGIEGDAGRDRQHPVLADLARRPARGCPSSLWPGSGSGSRRCGRDRARSRQPARLPRPSGTARPSWLRAAGSCRSRRRGGSDPRLRSACRLAGGRSCRARERFRAAASRDSTSPIRSVERLVFDPLRAVRCEPAVATAMTGPCVTRTGAGRAKALRSSR